MADRPIIYSQQQARSFDILNGWKDQLKAIGNLAQLIIGSSNTVIDRLTCAAQSIPNLTLNLAAGEIYQWAPFDSTAYGSLASDTSNLTQQGYVDQQVLTFVTGGLSAGQSQWVLVQAAFLQADSIRDLDPTGGLLPYYNSANPAVPLQGPAGGGATQPTIRKGLCSISLNYGTPATSGSQVAPAPSANNVPLYLVLLTFGQTAITNGQILKSAPGCGGAGTGTDGAIYAPFFPGLTKQHHLGTGNGQGPPIDLTAEVANVLPLPHLPATNQTPPAIAGNITFSGKLAVVIMGTVNPNGNIAGQQGDIYVNTTGGTCWQCTVSGNSAGAVWIGMGGTSNSVIVVTGNFVPVAGAVYEVDTTGGAITATCGLAASYGAIPWEFKVIGANPLTITPGSGEQIEGNGANNSVVFNFRDAGKMLPKPSYGWWIK